MLIFTSELSNEFKSIDLADNFKKELGELDKVINAMSAKVDNLRERRDEELETVTERGSDR